jgi:ribosomal protein S18 acetylase RimI-like enzyme
VDSIPIHVLVPGHRFAHQMSELRRANDDPFSLPDVSFRRFEQGDIPGLARLARDAWPARPAVGSRELEQSGMEGYVEYSLGSSNWTDIAFTPEGVVGFLFGRIDNYHGRTVVRKSMLGEFPNSIKSFIRKGRVTPWHLSMIWGIVLTDLKLMLRMPESDASIEMFIVDSRHRGKGIGGELFRRFLDAAREAGSSLVTVYTDDRMSNWNYYEKLGFKRVATFHDNITSRYSGTDANGIILALELGSR